MTHSIVCWRQSVRDEVGNSREEQRMVIDRMSLRRKFDSSVSQNMDLPKNCVRLVKSGTDGLTRNRFLRIRPQARGIGGGGKCPPPPQNLLALGQSSLDHAAEASKSVGET